MVGRRSRRETIYKCGGADERMNSAVHKANLSAMLQLFAYMWPTKIPLFGVSVFVGYSTIFHLGQNVRESAGEKPP